MAAPTYRPTANGRGVRLEHGGLDEPLTRGQAAARQPNDGCEEVVVEALGVGGTWTRREEMKSGDRCGGERRDSPFI
jgi:hypothetical protein